MNPGVGLMRPVHFGIKLKFPGKTSKFSRYTYQTVQGQFLDSFGLPMKFQCFQDASEPWSRINATWCTCSFRSSPLEITFTRTPRRGNDRRKLTREDASV